MEATDKITIFNPNLRNLDIFKIIYFFPPKFYLTIVRCYVLKSCLARKNYSCANHQESASFATLTNLL